jgi:hypothetical protein
MSTYLPSHPHYHFQQVQLVMVVETAAASPALSAAS